MADTGTVVVEIGRERYATRVVAGSHRLVVDEPGTLGGADTGPGPFDLLLASIGSCTVITARMYADRKGWPLEGVRAELSFDGAGVVRMGLEFEGELSAAQRERLRVIAGKCPVKRAVTEGLRVEVG
jgi:putative redox protein